jgi:hypothetical protein
LRNHWEENKLFAYIENSYTFNLTGAGRGGVNELRFSTAFRSTSTTRSSSPARFTGLSRR